MDKAPAIDHRVPRSNPDIGFFDFSLFSFFMELPLACESWHEYSISIFTDHTFARGGYMFLETCFLETCFLETCFLETNVFNILVF